MYHCPVNKTVYIFSLWLFGSGKCVGQMCVCVCVCVRMAESRGVARQWSG